MGITGLLPFLEKASSVCHLGDLRGKCVAIDSYCWLHRGAFGCAERLAYGEPTDMHIQYCMKYVKMLLSYNIKPILVFDGRHLPAKAATETKRRENREKARKRGAELLRLGRIVEARSYLRRCVDITHEMALQLIKECRKQNVDCIVAPYEADAQLAFLNRADIAQYVITEDSDLVLFGCSRILFKVDLAGNGRLVDASKLHLAMGCPEDRFKFAKFRYMCILSGCDYLDSLPGIGLAKACRFVLRTEDADFRRALAKIPSYLNMRQLTVSEEYKDEFFKADATFKHMVVYDPVQRRQTRLLDPGEEGTPEECCCNAGQLLDEKTAFNLALGNLDPFSLRQMDDWHPDTASDVDGTARSGTRCHPSIWNKNYYALKAEKEKKAKKSQSSSEPKTIPLTAFVKRSPPIADFYTYSSKETICDVLKDYGIQQNEPPRKRIRHTETAQPAASSSVAIAYDDVEALDTMTLIEQLTTPKRNRNPFAVSSSGPVPSRDSPNALLSPTKLTPENCSLLQNFSPVKRIDYSQQRHVVMTTTTTTTTSTTTTTTTTTTSTTTPTTATTSGLSRFKRANATGGSGTNAGLKVISRFFCSQQKPTATHVNATVAPTTIGGSPETNKKPASSSYASPTAIVKEIKSKRSRILEETALYLQSPDARQPNRGERTPEKCLLEHHLGSPEDHTQLGPLDSGRAMDPQKDDAPWEESSRDGSSSSQKENDGTYASTTEKKFTSPRSIRLALVERQHGEKMDELNGTPNKSEDLVIVLDDDVDDDDDDDKGCTGHGARTLVAAITKETLEKKSAPEVRLKTSPNFNRNEAGSNKSAMVGPANSKPRSSCRRPGLAANRKQSSKSDKKDGLTQSKLSMFGFQKKPSMQLGNQ